MIGLAFFLVATLPAFAQETALEAENAALNAQIVEVDALMARYDGGLILTLAETRRQALLLARTLVENQMRAERGDAITQVVVPTVQPDPARAKQLLGEMASAQARIETAKQEADKSGGLIQALALSRVETERLTLAQLQMGYLQAKYGIAFPAGDKPSPKAARPQAVDTKADAKPDTVETQKVAWADARFPDIDYTSAPFEQAHKAGEAISGWWTIKTDRAPIDDSPMVSALNMSAYKPNSFSGITTFIARCSENETAAIFIQDDFLLTDFRRNSFAMTIRIGDAPARQTRWSSLTSNKGAGLFGRAAEQFLRDIYDADTLFLRLAEKNGKQHDAMFQLAGQADAIEAVADACGWTTLSLTRDDYRAIQTLLNAGGFDSGTPDGHWGAGSRGAMRAFQAKMGLKQTGAPDRETLSQLGFGGG